MAPKPPIKHNTVRTGDRHLHRMGKAQKSQHKREGHRAQDVAANLKTESGSLNFTQSKMGVFFAVLIGTMAAGLATKSCFETGSVPIASQTGVGRPYPCDDVPASVLRTSYGLSIDEPDFMRKLISSDTSPSTSNCWFSSIDALLKSGDWDPQSFVNSAVRRFDGKSAADVNAQILDLFRELPGKREVLSMRSFKEKVHTLPPGTLVLLRSGPVEVVHSGMTCSHRDSTPDNPQSMILDNQPMANGLREKVGADVRTVDAFLAIYERQSDQVEIIIPQKAQSQG